MQLMIREKRKELGLTQTELAQQLGTNLNTVSNWERGKTFPDAEQIWGCAIALKCTPNDLLGWAETKEIETALERELIDNYRASSPERQDRLIDTSRDCAAMSKDAAERNEFPSSQVG